MSDANTRPVYSQEDPLGDPAPEAVEQGDSDTVTPTDPLPEDPERRSWSRDLRFMLVVLAAIAALFLAFALLIAFSPTGAAISALAVIAAPIATMVAAYYGISLALRQVADARNAAVTAEARARAAESSAHDSDAWAAQMESGLRVAVSKLKGAGIGTSDVERAAGTPDEFF
ncbi:hypothetical protein SAMN05428970_2226 [Agromyces sp. CF514]|uniref:hypothetical protein n=1 Tax=Agromyces sp. CF514 TaxID=1881031 RepID=UPI0008EC08BE|nr:hypothetical protein [Agromyces sp. CF514]SFR77411.1 hypothetical protein SAMN05428970_2226 [Agromyces sp. CF514]